MPWSPSQIRLFRAAAHDPAIARSHGLSMGRADMMSHEGIRHCSGGPVQRFAVGGIAQPIQPVQLGPQARSGVMGTGSSHMDGNPNPFQPQNKPDIRSKLLAGVNQRIRQEQNVVDAAGQTIGIMRGSTMVPPGYAEGGGVEDYLPYAGMAAAALAGRHLPRGINAAARPFLRPLARPSIGIEATSKVPLSEAMARQRFDLARDNAMSEHAKRPYEMGQGAWMGDEGMQFNPLFMQKMPRTFGDLADRPDYMQYLGQMGSNLDQEGAPISRFVPNLINTSQDANAMMAHGVDAPRLRSIATELGPDWAVAHRPGNKALMFPLGGDSPSWSDIASRVKPHSKSIRYGRSDPLKDRVILSKTPWGDKTYDEVGAMNRDTDTYRGYEDRVLGGGLNYLESAP